MGTWQGGGWPVIAGKIEVRGSSPSVGAALQYYDNPSSFKCEKVNSSPGDLHAPFAAFAVAIEGVANEFLAFR